MTTSAKCNQSYQQEIDRVNLVFIDENTSALVSAEVLSSILNLQIQNKLLTKLLQMKEKLSFDETAYLLLSDTDL
jgi:hypothetical protein